MDIGYTTGVFDLYHVGHLNILKKSKEHCDKLIVGVTTDELAYKRKNKMPIIPFEERVEIIESVRYVDKVVSQPSMDKVLAWKNYKFNKMFVGSDWKGTEKWNNLEIELGKHGVEIIYFPYTKSTSSTIIREVLEGVRFEGQK